MLKRITLFLATNLAIVFMASLVMTLLGSLGFLGRDGALGAYQPLVIMAAVMGFGGSIVSLLISKWVAKWTTGAQVITSPRNRSEAWLLETVERQAQRLGISTPEVAVYDSPTLNAFATGPTRNNALVAVSSGLLQSMRDDEIEAVIGHEVSHVANGDMVTLTLIQGVLNTFVIVGSRVIGGFVDRVLLRSNDNEDRGPGIGYFVVTMVAQLVLGIMATLIVMAFSRYREYRADAGGAGLAGRDKMIAALRRLGQGSESQLPQALTAFGINSDGRGFLSLFMSHPPIEDRIRRLSQAPA